MPTPRPRLRRPRIADWLPGVLEAPDAPRIGFIQARYSTQALGSASADAIRGAGMTHLPHPDTDPLPQLLADHPELSGTLVVASQVDAVAGWPRIARHDGEVAIMLRRAGPEDASEWRDMLAILRELIPGAQQPVRLLALSDEVATTLAAELDRPVDVAPRLSRRYNGSRCFTLCRADGAVRLRTGDGALHPAGRYNLARLRRRARIEGRRG